MTPVTLSRAHRASAAALVLCLALVGCGSSETDSGYGSGSDSDTSSDGGSELMPAAEGTTTYPLTLDTWLGESTLEERPERVAVFGYSSTLDSLEAIGVTPVYYGGRDVNEAWPWNDPAFLEAIETKDQVDDFVPKAEAIAAADPDLIITTGILTDQAQFDRLSSIAPVLDVPEDPGNGDQSDWRAEQLAVGEALDLTEAADTAVTDADAQIAAVAEAHPEFAGKTATIAFDYGPEYGLDYYTVAGGPAEGLLLDLGFDPNPLAEDFVANPTVSDENQGKLDADALVMIYNTQPERETREGQELFASIPAAEDGRYESLVYAEDAAASDPLTTSAGAEAENAVWVLRRGASAIALPWAAEVVADQWLGSIELE